MVSGSSAVTTQRRLVNAVICLVGAVCILRKIVRASIVVGRGRGFASTVNALFWRGALPGRGCAGTVRAPQMLAKSSGGF